MMWLWAWLAAVCLSVALPALCLAQGAEDGCAHTIVGSSVSPDVTHQAFVDESVCAGALDTSDITATVRVARLGAAGQVTSILGVDTGGHQEDRPHLSWSRGDVLDVTVPNLSYLKILTLQPPGIQVGLHFSPPDPAARAAWLRRQNLPPDRFQ